MAGFNEFCPLIGIIFAFVTIKLGKIETVDLRIGSSDVELMTVSAESYRGDRTLLLGFAVPP